MISHFAIILRIEEDFVDSPGDNACSQDFESSTTKAEEHEA
jgi:hypothetical protein